MYSSNFYRLTYILERMTSYEPYEMEDGFGRLKDLAIPMSSKQSRCKQVYSMQKNSCIRKKRVPKEKLS